MYSMTKKLLLGIILSAPFSVAFADAAIDAKIAAAKAKMIKDFSPPKATQYLPVANSRRAAPSEAPAEAAAPQQPASQAPEAPSGFGNAPKSSGSWYVQPGDTGSSSNGNSGSGFDHSNLY